MKKTILALALLPAVAHAGGILVGENGSQAMERAGAFVAKADDPSALVANPAGLANIDHMAIYVGLNLLSYDLKFQRQSVAGNGEPATFPLATSDSGVQPIPLLSAVFKIQNLALAAGFWAPTSFPNRNFPCVNDVNCTVDAQGTPAPQRYDIVHQEVIIAYPSLAAAYRILPSLDVGFRASWGFGSVKARNFPWALRNDAEDPGFDGDFNASVTDSMMWNFGGGILFRPTDNLEIGAAASSGGRFKGKGTGVAVLGNKVPQLPGFPPPAIVPVPDDKARCDKGGTQVALKTCVNFSLPRKGQLGLRYIFRDGGRERGDIEVDGRFEEYNGDADVEIIVDGMDNTLLAKQLNPVLVKHGFQNVWSGRLGGSYRLDIDAKDAVTLRGGLSFDTAAAPDNWARADIDTRARQYLSLGVALDIPGWRFDAGVSYVHEGTTTATRVPYTGDQCPLSTTEPNYSQPNVLQPSNPMSEACYHPINDGTYDSGYLVGSFGVTAMF